MIKESAKEWLGEAKWVGVSLVLSVLALLVGTRFLTEMLSTNEYGELSLAISLAMLAVQMGGTPLAFTALRYYAHCKNEGSLHMLRGYLVRCLSISAAIVLLITVATMFYSYIRVGLQDAVYIFMVGVFAVLLLSNRLALGLEDAARKRKVRAIIQGGFEIGRFVLAIGLIVAFAAQKASIALAGFLLAALLAVIVHGVILRLDVLKPPSYADGAVDVFNGKQYRLFAKFTLPLVVSYSCLWVVLMAERWSLHFNGNLADVGGYAAVHQLAFIPMTILSNFVLLLTTPIIFQLIGVDTDSEKHNEVMRYNRYISGIILLFALVGSLLLGQIHPVVAQLFLGVEFHVYSWMFPWLFLSGGCFAAAQQLLLKMTSEFRTSNLALLWVMMAVVSAVAYLVGVRLGGVDGLVFMVVGVNVLLLLMSIILSFSSKISGCRI